VWRWTDVDSKYITRLHLLQTPFGSIMLHWINKPDPEPYDHDHPVTFLSLVLRGGYSEKRNGKTHVVSWFNFIRANEEDQHTIIFVKPNTLTLCLMGPKTREWGFHRPNGWIYWKDYYAEKRSS
jgi:hypothetical protein